MLTICPRFCLQLIESPGKTMGSRYEVKDLRGKLGPGPGGYAVDKAKKQNFSYS